MPDRAGLKPDPASRAEELLRRAGQAAGRFVDGLNSLGYLRGARDEAARAQIKEEAARLFIFVILSVLLEGRSGQDPHDKTVAEKMKTIYALEIVQAKQAIRQASRQALPGSEARELAHRLDAAEKDPFAPYYNSFGKMIKNPESGPFGIFADRVTERFFSPEKRRAGRESVFTLSASLADELLDLLG